MMYNERDLAVHKKKRHYVTKKEAKIHLRRLRSLTGTHKQQSFYRCPVCEYYCLTSIKKQNQNKFRK